MTSATFRVLPDMANPGEYNNSTEQPTDHLLLDYQAWLRSWSASTATIQSRTYVIRAALDTWGPLEQITTETLAAWLSDPDYRPWTRYTYYGHLRSFFGWLHESGRIPTNPAAGLRAPRQPKGKPRPLNAAQVDRVLDAAHGHQKTWLLLGLYAGLRAHEIAKLRGQDVDETTIYVIGKGQQGAMLPTHPLLWEVARQYPRTGWWFPSPSQSGHIGAGTVSTMTTRLFSGLGIEGSIHRCRHTYGTNLLRGGANLRVVQSLMRHSSLATTELYTAVDEDEQTAAIRGLVA